MNHQQTDFPHAFVMEYFELIAQYIPGDTTLNQIRILHYIDMRTAAQAGHTSHKEICAALSMPAATVTRAVASFIEAGMVREEQDDFDARRRLVMVSEPHSMGDTLDKKVIELARRYFRK